MVIVEVQPAWQCGATLGVRRVEAGVGRAVGEGAVEALDLPVGLRTDGREGCVVPDVERSASIAPGMRLVSGPVV